MGTINQMYYCAANAFLRQPVRAPPSEFGFRTNVEEITGPDGTSCHITAVQGKYRKWRLHPFIQCSLGEWWDRNL
jgi:hypothetical protein